MLLIGSRALSYWTEFKASAGSDYDFLVDPDTDCSPQPELVDFMPTFGQEVPASFRSGEFVSTPLQEVEVCSLEGLAAIKRSHLWRDYFWDKHIAQYNSHLRRHLNKEHRPWINDRAKLLKESLRYSQPSLKQTNEDFFDDAVDKKYDHDWLHELVAYGEHPIYLDMKRDFSLAWCEKDMWDEFPQDKKVKCVAEEAYVIALERFLIPKDWQYSYVGAYLTALKKVCTTLTSGWFRDFAIDNLPEIMAQFEKQKVESLKEKLNG